MALILWIAIPVVVVYVLATLLPDGPSGASGAVKFVDVLQQLPTQWYFYALVLALISSWIYRHRQLHVDLREKFEQTRLGTSGHDLNERDWWVAAEFRKRALDLRLRADLILGSVLAILFGGVYFVIFVTQQIPDIDREIATLRAEAEIKRKYGQMLDSLVAGQYWLKVTDDEGKARFIEDNNASATKNMQIVLFRRRDLLGWWSTQPLKFKPGESGRIAAFSANGMAGLVSGNDGSIHATTDGGKTWSQSALNLQDGESVTGAVFSADGMAALVRGDEGSVQMTTDRGETWHKKVLSLPVFRSDTEVLSVDGMSALVTDDEGLVYMTADGGKTWSKTALKMDGEQIAVAGSSVRGAHALVVSRQGSVPRDHGRRRNVEPIGVGSAGWRVGY